jgi:hypothetical protein
MGSTYLTLTNKVLRKINEVELTETTFASARGIHAVAKDSVLDAINEMNQQKWEWPYYALEYTQTLVDGQSEYSWPSQFKSADWESFYLLKDTGIPITSKPLEVIDRDEWYKYFRPDDTDGNKDTPKYIFKGHGNKFGVTPAPDKAYMLNFRYYRTPTQLSLYSDVCSIPIEYDNVIVLGALAHVNLFKENVEASNICRESFKNSIKDMYSNLIGYQDHMFESRTSYAQSSIISKSGNYKL